MLTDIWDAVSSIPNKIQELAKSVGDFFSNFWDSLTEGLGNVVSSIGEFFENLGTNIGNWFSNLWTSIENIFSWLGDFFVNLYDFFIHIFIPTNEQWDEIGNDYIAMGETIKNHIPFIGLFSEELKKAQETVEKTDFLVITIPSFNYSGSGGVGVSTSEQKVVNVGQVYEPYRAYVRGALLLVVVGLAFVYIIKYVLNYGVTQGNSNIIEGQTSFLERK